MKNTFTSRCNYYVAVLVPNNKFSNSLKSSRARKSQNSFGSMNIKSSYGNGVSLRFSYFPSKDPREFEFFMISTEIIKSVFFALNGRGKVQNEVRNYWLTSNRDIIYLSATASKVFLSTNDINL